MGRRAVAVVIVVNALFLAVLACWAKAGWPGKPNHLTFGNAFYCEAFRPGWVRQPANTFSNIGFIAMGLYLATRAKSWRGAAFALIISLLGPGSMALHASMTALGGGIDVSSMFIFIGFATAHDAARLSSIVDRNFAPVLAATCVVMTALGIWGHEFGPRLFAALIAVFLLLDALVAFRKAGAARDRRRLALGTGFFFAGYACWLLSEKSTSFWCSPYSWFQGHAAWHLFCALAAGSIYWYLEPELV